MKVDVKRLNHQGMGIAYDDEKIIFIHNALPDEEVNIEIIRDTSKYKEAKVIDIVKPSKKRVKSKCPYSDVCGGCALRNMSYSNTLLFKKNKLQEIFAKYSNLNPKIEIIKSPNKDYYRNKLEIKINDGLVGFYKNKTHDLVEIDKCLNAEEAINSFLLDVNLLHVFNGEVIIKSNYNKELIIIIKSDDLQNIEVDKLRSKHKIVGIVYNGKTIFGNNSFIEIVDNLFFKESFDSFFQVNRGINSELFKILKENVEEGSKVLDLCCGVGTLSIVASLKAKSVYGIEIVKNAVCDAVLNAKMNKRDNVKFILGDIKDSIEKINDDIDTVIIDPPRSGLDEVSRNAINKIISKKIIYVSCDPITLARDLNAFKNYNIKKFYMLDMFPYTYHVESVVILEKVK